MEIKEFRKAYPQYQDLPDQELTQALHKKFYSDMPLGDFTKKFNPSAAGGSIAKTMGGVTRSLYSGATLGFADELEAGIGAAHDKLRYGEPFGQRYAERKADIGAEQKEFVEANPVTSAGLELAGGIPTVAVGGAGLLASKAVTALPKYARLPAVGAAFGSAAGAGTAPDTESLPGDMGRGALIGGAVSAALPALATGAQYVGRKVGDAFPAASGTTAQRKLSQALARDKISPEYAQSALNRMGPQATLADVGGANVAGLARAATAFPGRAKDAAQKMLDERQAGQSGRMLDEFKSIFGDTKYREYADDLIKAQRETARPLYAKAYEKAIPLDDELKELLARPTVQNAAKRAYRIAADEGDKIPAPTSWAASGTAPTKVLDYTKRGLDDVIDANTDDFGRVRGAEGHAAVTLKNKLLKKIDAANQDYAAARKAYAGPESLKQASRKGVNFFREGADDLDVDFNRLSASEQDAFRVGALQALRNKILSSSDTADTTKKLFSTPALRDKIKTIFPEAKSFESFKNFMEREQTFFKTRAHVLGGSPTARIEAEKLDAVADPGVVANILGGNLGTATLAATRKLFGGQRALAEPVSEEMAPLLFGQGGGGGLRALLEAEKKRALQAQARAGAGRGLAIGAGAGAAGLLGSRGF